MRNKQQIKLFIVLFICTAFIFSFSHYGATAYNALTSNMNGFSEGTKIGPVDVTGKSNEDAIALLNERLGKWQSETSITLQYKEKSASIDIGQFQFDLQNSVALAKEGQQNEVTVTFKSGDLYQNLKDISSDLNNSSVKLDPMLTEILTLASNFSSGEHQVKVDKFLVAEPNNNEIISEASIETETAPIDLGFLAEKLSPIKIEENSKFSLLELIEERQLTSYSQESASMIATAIYQTLLASNFSIVEKHTSGVLPDYVELGFEARVDFHNHLDLVFVNPNDMSYEITIEAKDNKLTAALKGISFLNDYRVKLEENQEFKPKTIIQYSPLLTENAIRIQEKGRNGRMIKVYREVFGENDEWLNKEFLSEDYYPPIHRVEIHALGAPGTAGPTDGQAGTNQGAAGTGESSGTNIKENNGAQSQTDNDNDLFGKQNETLK